MRRLILIRHGETDWNVEGRWQGQIDVPLNDRGREHARQVAVNLADEGIQVIYSSDLSRALDTAEPLGNLLNLPIQKEARLREINQGEWQGLLVSEIRARYAKLFRKRRENPQAVAPPGGETVTQVQERVYQALDDILRKHPHQTIAIVAHGFVIAVLRLRYENKLVDEVWNLIPASGQWYAYELE